MRTLPFTVVMMLACACGPTTSGPGFDVDLVTSAGLLDQLSAFQISLVTQGSTLDCVAVEKTCLKSQVAASRFVPLTDASGKTRKALLVPLMLVAGTPSVQTLNLTNLAPGKDFALVIEAVSKDSPARLAGSSCSFVKELTTGTNAQVSAHIDQLSPTVQCDVPIDP